MKLEKDLMTVKGKGFPCVVSVAGKDEAPEMEESEEEAVDPLPVFGRRAVFSRKLPANLTPETVTPSSLHGEPTAGGMKGLLEETCGAPLDIDLEVAGADRGLILHKCFEVLGGRADRLDLLERATGLRIGKEASARLGQAVSGFDRWLSGRFGPLRVLREVPLLGVDERGSVMSGILDLLVESAEGYWVLDHKSDVTDVRNARFEAYLPQLRAYAGLVRKAFPGKPVLGVGIHWISYGTVSLLPEGVAS
jgi:hypothetical protein